ncbi:MAG: alpha/beta fold hydrolase [bacterium]
MSNTVQAGFFSSQRHTTHYLHAGNPADPAVIFVHGWPELSLSWRHQLPAIASLGYYAVAPDMRGYGQSSLYPRHEDYALRESVQDMLELLQALGKDQAVWVGHDWGSPVVWSLARHHPDKCAAVANLCVPYDTLELGWEGILVHVDRTVYPLAQFPDGQWEYMRFYEEQFDSATATFDSAPEKVARALFRAGIPDNAGMPSVTAFVRQQNGWFGGGEVPDVPRDDTVISADELQIYARHLQENGFFGPDSWYMNHALNARFTAQAGSAHLDMPVLFLHGRFDTTCETMTSTLAEPMRAKCRHLTEHVVDSGHWMAQEQPHKVNAHLTTWLHSAAPVSSAS